MNLPIPKNPHKKIAVIAGAGPAGLTCALELLKYTDYVPIIIEKDIQVGGISKTVHYQGNRIDIGGHRFFSKSERVLKWWNDILPFEAQAQKSHLQYQNQTTKLDFSHEESVLKAPENQMLLRSRKSRIYYNREYFDYPINLNITTLRKLGIGKSIKIILAYAKVRLNPRKPEKTLEDFFINRFGTELYKTFFKSYTEKIWGKKCDELSAEWGKQRVKNVSLEEIAIDFLYRIFLPFKKKNVSTSLIQHFLYPPYGPGQMWEEVAREVIKRGGTIMHECEVVEINAQNTRIESIVYKDTSGIRHNLSCDLFFSTMPVQQLISSLKGITIPSHIKKNASLLEYRDFLTVGILVPKNKMSFLDDNWIYIHESKVRVARIQIFNNWSEKMVHDQNNIWLGMEYIINKNDDLWKKKDSDIIYEAKRELELIKFIQNKQDVLDATVVKVEKAYPVYAGSYGNFQDIRTFVDSFPNLFLLGRNGMHRYNNQDHSMLTAMTAVDMIKENNIDKSKIWNINIDDNYHESN